MTDPSRIRRLLDEANPVPDPMAAHPDESAADVLFSAINERRGIMQTEKRPATQTALRRRRNGWLVAAGAAIAVFVLIGGFVGLVGGNGTDVVEEPTVSTTSPVPTTTAPVPVPPTPPIVDSWQRVGEALMEPVVGTFDMTVAGSRLFVVGFDPGEDDYRQNGVIFASDDGISWVRLAQDDPALNLGTVLMYSVTEGGPGLVAAGIGCENETEECPPHATVWTSVDGTSWTRTPEDPAIFGNGATQTSGMMDVTTTTTGSLVAVGWIDDWTLDDSGVAASVVTRPATWTSQDGVAWEQTWLGEGYELTADVWNNVLTQPMLATVQGPDGDLVSVGAMLDQDGESTAAVWTSTDGSTWDRIDPTSPVFGQKTTMTDITWGPDGYVAVGTDSGTDAAIWQSPDGVTWTRVDTAAQSFDGIGSLGSVASLDSGYVTVGGHAFVGRGGRVTLWTSPDGVTWDRVHSISSGYASSVVVVDEGIAVSGGMPYDDDYHAAVWVGPRFDPEAPPPEPPMPQYFEEEGEAPTVDPATTEGADVGAGDPNVAPPGDDDATLESGEARLPLGQITDVPDSIRLDFLTAQCDDASCFRDPMFVDPDDDGWGTPYWISDTPFHIRHGFVNETEAPLGEDFDVVVYITRQEGPELTSGTFDLGQTYRFDSDYVVQGTTTKCGPGYWEQTKTQTCEWFVHDFAEGLPAGRYDIWTGWYAPCSAWQDLGLVDACDNPDDVTPEFSSAVNSPWLNDDYTEGLQPPFDPEAMFTYGGSITRGWPSD